MDGIICTNDDLAIGALYECQRRGISVPSDIAIAGFHGHNFSQVIVPRLATVKTPREKIGRLAAEQLLERLEGKPITQSIFDLPFEVLDGETLSKLIFALMILTTLLNVTKTFGHNLIID